MPCSLLEDGGDAVPLLTHALNMATESTHKPLDVPFGLFGKDILSASELDVDLDSITFGQHLLGFSELRLEVVLVNLVGELDLLDVTTPLLGALVADSLHFLVLVLLEVHELDHRWRGTLTQLDQIETAIVGQEERLFSNDHAQLRAIVTNEAKLWGVDRLVHPLTSTYWCLPKLSVPFVMRRVYHAE